jgi:hypothetical protein
MLITNDAFLILLKLLVLSITEVRHTAQMSYTAYTTKSILEATQEKKKKLYVLKGQD